ncbi:hypothetical protein EVAR_49194_1 [Eumeta japonica]|uniref:Reverse transcriptase domain-containing protein n=1 Tax=Eumeta variegata TaxID=151549 RepID=A0A4C1XMA7_EUMVA|nr:hypothetical protein EVAR_49194_1 [Eumeta japonica]
MNEKKGNDTISLAPITSDIPATINKENKASIPTPTPISLCTVDPCRALAIADPCLRERAVATSILLGTAQCNALDSLDTVLAGIGDVTSSIEGVTCLTIRSRYDDSVRFTIQPLVVNRITNALPTANIDHTRLDYLNDLPLADFKYYKPANIDLILGSDLFARILRHKTVSRGTTEPVAVETLLEEVPDVSLLTPEENECELIYSSTVKRESSGRYVTVIPFKGDPNTLGDSLQSATRSADIRQMYLQILTNVNHHRWQRLLYRFNTNDSLQLFEMTRVPFGLRSSPYIANRTVRQLIIDERDRYPLAAQSAQNYLYMDDLASSYPSEDEAIEVSNQLIKLFKAGGFELVKFSSNSPCVLKNIPHDHRVSEVIEFDSNDNFKILGVNWHPAADMLSFRVESDTRECTKRNILSTIARFWDLMGFVAPVTLLAKLIIKSLWERKIAWDEIPPQNIISIWNQFQSELPLLENVQLSRHVGVTANCTVSILGFADASEKAYGGVVYIHV